MSLGVLLGRDHVELGRIAAIAEGSVAIALSRGGAAKTYHYREPNEDAVGFRRGPGGSVLVAADGHGGTDAAELAVERVLENLGRHWVGSSALGDNWDPVARALVGEIHAGVLAAVAGGGNAEARSTLAFSVIRPDQGQIYWASIGDSHIFRVARNEVIELTGDDEEATFYLGSPHHSENAMTARVRSGQNSLADTRAMILSTDGLSERGIGVDLPEAAVLEAVDRAVRLDADLAPLETARHLVELALEAHRRHKAGDNMATAVHWF